MLSSIELVTFNSTPDPANEKKAVLEHSYTNHQDSCLMQINNNILAT